MLRRLVLSALMLALCLTVAMGEGLRLEFEDGEMLGGAFANGEWVEGLKRKGDGVTLSFEVEEDGQYDISVITASQSGRMQNDLVIDGETVGRIYSEGTAFTPQYFSGITLSKGAHTLGVVRDYGWVRLDAVTIAPSPVLNASVYDVEPTLTNPNASTQAQALMAWLCENFGVNMISGQYLDEGQYGREIKVIDQVTGGLRPALVGLDLMNYSPASVSLGSYPTSVDQAIEYWKKGHIVTFCWHWVAPEKYLDTTGNNWWGGFYTENTSFDLRKAMNGEDPEGYALILRDLDAIAAQLARLRDAGVPVLWRPLHEASGGWFWWGAGGRDAYIELYRLMYDKFTNEYGLNNLIWVWNGQSAYWYPGDDVVDVIGEDVYPGKHVHASQAKSFEKCLSYTGVKKLIMLSECGCVPSPDSCLEDNSLWSSWAVWCYEFVLDKGAYSEQYTGAEDLKAFYNHENVLTLRDVPSFGRTFESEKESANADALSVEFEDGTLFGAAFPAGIGADKWVEIRGNEETDGVAITFTVANTDEYDLTLVQAGIGGHKENHVYLDGVQMENNAVVSGEEWENTSLGRGLLEAGEHTLEIKAFWGWVKLDKLLLTSAHPAPKAIKAEFEDGTLFGAVQLGALGADQWVELRSNDENDYVTVTLDIPEDGTYVLVLREAGIGGYKENYLYVDGTQMSNTVVNGTEWEECQSEEVLLAQGEHEIKVSCFWGWCKLDWVKAEKVK